MLRYFSAALIMAAVVPPAHAQFTAWSETYAVGDELYDTEGTPARRNAVGLDGALTTATLVGANGTDRDVLAQRRDGDTGALLWASTYTSAFGGALGLRVAVDDAGDAYLLMAIGNAQTWAADRVTLAKLDGTDGSLVWERHYVASAGRLTVQSLVVTTTGRVVTAFDRTGVSDYGTTMQAWSDAGALAWSRVWNGPTRAVLAAAPSGEVAVAAESTSGTRNFAVARVKTNGTFAWSTSFDSGAEDIPYDIAVDSAGDIIVAGQSGTASSVKRLVARFRKSNGSTLWQRSFTLPIGEVGTNNNDVRVAIRGGAVIMVNVDASAPNYNGFVARMSFANGALVWQTPIASALFGAAFDATGNTFVVRQDASYAFSLERLTFSTGALEWSIGSLPHIRPRIAHDPIAERTFLVNDVSVTSAPDMVRISAFE